MRSTTLYRVLAVLLVVIAAALAWSHFGDLGGLDLCIGWRRIAGVLAGVVIGVIAALMGVAGGELLIPTIVLLWGVDIWTESSGPFRSVGYATRKDRPRGPLPGRGHLGLHPGQVWGINGGLDM